MNAGEKISLAGLGSPEKAWILGMGFSDRGLHMSVGFGGAIRL